MSEILDSGARREFETGAVRDIAEGKGRCDLLPLDVVGALLHDNILCNFGTFIHEGNEKCLVENFYHFASKVYSSFETAILDVSVHYEDGCNKYGERNWEKGIPLHCFIDSAVRHYLKWRREARDERHDRAFLWNILGALWTLKNKPEMNDLPFAEKGKDA